MGLDITDRGALEKIIEHEIQAMPKLLPIFRTPQNKSRFQITNPEEFCYGFIHGRISGEFTVFYLSTHKIDMSDGEENELRETLEKELDNTSDFNAALKLRNTIEFCRTKTS